MPLIKRMPEAFSHLSITTELPAQDSRQASLDSLRWRLQADEQEERCFNHFSEASVLAGLMLKESLTSQAAKTARQLWDMSALP